MNYSIITVGNEHKIISTVHYLIKTIANGSAFNVARTYNQINTTNYRTKISNRLILMDCSLNILDLLV